MLINPSGGTLYFTFFYTLAFVFAFIMLLREGYQRKIPAVSWVILLIFARISFIAGTKIFTFSPKEWLWMIHQVTLIPSSEKILFGGIIFGLPALLAGKYILRIKQNIIDAFAIVVPIAFGIQKIGCFINGCCFGKPTSLPWSVQYPVNTLPHYSHYISGMIGPDQLFSLHIHPVQLYEVAGAFLVAVIVFKTRNLWKANGSLFVFSILSFCLVRFLTEFFRDIHAHTTGGEMIGIFNQVQWILLTAVITLSFTLFYRERRFVLPEPVSQFSSATIGAKYIMFIFTFEAILILALRHWFSSSELIVILVTFLISCVVIFSWILKEIASSRSKMIYAVLLLLPVLITSQTIPETKSDSTLMIRTKKISFGISSGNFENWASRKTGTSENGCDQYETAYFKQKYFVGGAGLSFKDEYPGKKFTTNYGLNVTLGQNKEKLEATNLETQTFLFGVNPYYKFDANWIGVGGGIHLGNLAYPGNENSTQTNLTTGLTKTAFSPQLYLRIGPKRFFYIDYCLADQFPSPFPGFYQQLGLGSGLGSRNDTYFRVGVLMYADAGGYCSAYLPINKDFSLSPKLIVFGRAFSQFSLGLHYNLSSKTVYRKNKKS
jgi:prolipoprotein diacylglyceryltransferase